MGAVGPAPAGHAVAGACGHDGATLQQTVDGIRERYGMDPQIKYFHTACVTDNSAEAVLRWLKP